MCSGSSGSSNYDSLQMHASMDIQQAFGCGLVAATSTLARVSLREAKHIPTSSTKTYVRGLGLRWLARALERRQQGHGGESAGDDEVSTLRRTRRPVHTS
jgi:hypothetical protein